MWQNPLWNDECSVQVLITRKVFVLTRWQGVAILAADGEEGDAKAHQTLPSCRLTFLCLHAHFGSFLLKNVLLFLPDHHKRTSLLGALKVSLMLPAVVLNCIHLRCKLGFWDPRSVHNVFCPRNSVIRKSCSHIFSQIVPIHTPYSSLLS